MTPSYETSTLVQYASLSGSQRERSGQPMFGAAREKQHPVQVVLGAQDASQLRKQRDQQSQQPAYTIHHAFPLPAKSPSPHHEDSLTSALSQTHPELVFNKGTSSSRKQAQTNVNRKKNTTGNPASVKQGRDALASSLRTQKGIAQNEGVQSGAKGSKIRKLKYIKADQMKLVSQDSQVRLQSLGNSSSQAVSLGKHSTNAPDPLMKKGIRLARPTGATTLSKARQQESGVRRVEESLNEPSLPHPITLSHDKALSIRQSHLTMEQTKQSKPQKGRRETPSPASFQTETPLQEVPPQVYGVEGEPSSMIQFSNVSRFGAASAALEPQMRQTASNLELLHIGEEHLPMTGAGFSKLGTAGKDSSGFGDTEEKKHNRYKPSAEVLGVQAAQSEDPDESGWFWQQVSARNRLDSDMMVAESPQQAFGDGLEDAFKISQARRLTGGVDMSDKQMRSPPHMQINKLDETPPLIRKIPDSDISHKSRSKRTSRNVPMRNGHEHPPSERLSEITDDPLDLDQNTHQFGIGSLESLQSTDSCASIKNHLSQSQKISNLGARYYINIHDDTDPNFLPRPKQQEAIKPDHEGKEVRQVTLEETKGTPRFTRQSQVLKSKPNHAVRKSLEQQSTLANVLKKLQGETSVSKLRAQRGANSKKVVHHRRTPEDQVFSQALDDNSISSLTQQKDTKSLIGILQKHQDQPQSNARSTQSSNNFQRHHQGQKTKIQMSKLSENLYPGGQGPLYQASSNAHSSATQHNNSAQVAQTKTITATPSSTGNTIIPGAVSSNNSQQSRSFNVGMSGLHQSQHQSQQSRKKLQGAQQSAISQWKQQNAKSTFMKLLQSRSVQAQKQQNTAPGKAEPPTPRRQSDKQKQVAGGGGARSNREKSGFQMLLAPVNSQPVVKQGINQVKVYPETLSHDASKEARLGEPVNLAMRQINKVVTGAKSPQQHASTPLATIQASHSQVATASKSQGVAQKQESQRQRLFQKQLSQTIKLTGISSGISPKASGDMPVEFTDQRSSLNLFRAQASKTTHFKKGASGTQRFTATASTPVELESGLPSTRDQRASNRMVPALIDLSDSVDTQVRDSSPRRARDASPRLHQKHLAEEDGLGPLPISSAHNRLSGLKSVSTLQQIENLKQVIREEKAQNHQRLVSHTQHPYVMVGKHGSPSPPPLDGLTPIDSLPTGRQLEGASEEPSDEGDASDSDDENRFCQYPVQSHSKDGQPLRLLYQSIKPNEAEMEGEETAYIDEDNVSETMQTMILQSQPHPRLPQPQHKFNEPHPTQQIQGMSKMQSTNGPKVLQPQNTVLANLGPGERLESAQQFSYQVTRSRKLSNAQQEDVTKDSGHAKRAPVLLHLESQDTYQITGPLKEAPMTPNSLLLRAESTQSMSNVIDKEPLVHQATISSIQRSGLPSINNSVQMRNNKLKFEQSRNMSSRPVQQSETRRQVQTQSSFTQQIGWQGGSIQGPQSGNWFVVFLERGLLSQIVKYLEVAMTLQLLTLIEAKEFAQNKPRLARLFENEFLRALDSYRSHSSNSGGKGSPLCQLVTNFFLQTLSVSQRQDDTFYKVAMQLRKGRPGVKQNSEQGVGFEIEKDVDRTFMDQTKFTDVHRHGLSIVLRAVADLESDIGYVQGLNFIIGNLLLTGEHCDPLYAQRMSLAVFRTLVSKLDIKNFYTEKMLGLKEALFKLECLLSNEMPELFHFLLEQNITVEYFASQWFLTLFQYDIEDVEQSATIMLMCMHFGQRVIFQIAFQLIQSIRGKLCLMGFERALIFLKDFASEPRFRTTDFLLEAIKNDRITNELLSQLGQIYSKMCARQLHVPSKSNQTPMAKRVKILRGTDSQRTHLQLIMPRQSAKDDFDYEFKNDRAVEEKKTDKRVKVPQIDFDRLNRVAMACNKPQVGSKPQRSPSIASDSSLSNNSNPRPFKQESPPQMPMLQASSSTKAGLVAPAKQTSLLGRKNKNTKGGSLSPQKQHVAKESGLGDFFLKLNPFAGSKARLKQHQSFDRSSSGDSAGAQGLNPLKADLRAQTTQVPLTSRVQKTNRTNEGLYSEKEYYGAREAPLFVSPQTAYRKYQEKHITNHNQDQSRGSQQYPERVTPVSAIQSQDNSRWGGGLSSGAISASHRSPRAYTGQSGGKHRKTATGTFNSRALVNLPGEAPVKPLNEEIDHALRLSGSKQATKKPSHRQKQKFAEVFNLEKLNSHNSLGPAKVKASSSRTGHQRSIKKQSSSRPNSSLLSSQVGTLSTLLLPSENIADSEQKEQKVNNISLYGSTNPKNLKMTQKRQDWSQQPKAGPQQTSPLLEDALQMQGRATGDLVDWDEDDLLVRQDKLPKIPVSLKTGLKIHQKHAQSQNLMKQKMIRQFKLQRAKVDKPNSKCPSDLVLGDTPSGSAVTPLPKNHSSSQENVYQKESRKSSKKFQQDVLHSRDKKLMGQLNQSLEESKQGTTSSFQSSARASQRIPSFQDYSASGQITGPFQDQPRAQVHQPQGHKQATLKESKSHDRDKMPRVMRVGKDLSEAARGKQGLARERSKHNRQRLFNVVLAANNSGGKGPTADMLQVASQTLEPTNLENLQDLDEENLTDGKIPPANISSYNSHQSNKKLSLQAKPGLNNYASNGSNALEETCVISHANHVVLRKELRHSKLAQDDFSHQLSAFDGATLRGESAQRVKEAELVVKEAKQPSGPVKPSQFKMSLD